MTSELAFPHDAEDSSVLGLMNTEIKPEDVRRLEPFLATAADIQEALNPAMAAKILANLSRGLTECGSLLAAASFHANQAKSAREKAQAIAALDDFPVYVNRNPQIKPTDKTRDYFVDRHDLVLRAKLREDFYKALYEKLSINKNVLMMAIASARAIAFGYRTESSLSSSAVPVEDK